MNGGKRQTAAAAFGIIGSVLIGGGIILLLAHNWYMIPRLVRTVISLIPLLASQIFAFNVIIKKRWGFAVKESAALFLQLMILSSISLIAQIYHLPGDLEQLFMIWTFLSIPICYLLKSDLSFTLSLAGAVTWALFDRGNSGTAALYWVFFIALLPYYLAGFMKDRGSNQSLFLTWIIIISFCFSLAFSFIDIRMVDHGFWLIAYSAFFVTLYLLENEIRIDTGNLFKKPFLKAGSLGIGFLSCILFTYSWFWENAGIGKSGGTGKYFPAAAGIDYFIFALLILAPVFLLLKNIKKNPLVNAAHFLMLPLAALGYLYPDNAKYVFQIYSIVLSFSLIFDGVKKNKASLSNWGIFLAAVLIITRFFDEELSFITRGIAFLVLGLVFVGVNFLFYSRKNIRGLK